MKPGPARVLAALRRAGGRTCSGASLSSEQGVSRAQVWKDVEALRARGYTIEATPATATGSPPSPTAATRGDRRGPRDALAGARSALARETDSTNRVALELARAGAAHGTTVVAEAQTAGRGRLGRTLLLAAAHRTSTPRSCCARGSSPPTRPPWILAARSPSPRRSRRRSGDRDAVEIKWPNDVLLGGRKTSGILMELARRGHPRRLPGARHRRQPERRPRELPRGVPRHARRALPATAGARSIASPSRAVCTMRSSARSTPARERGFAALRPRFEARFRMRGRRSRVLELDGTRRRGVAEGVGRATARCCSRRDDGELARVVAGDVTLAKETA